MVVCMNPLGSLMNKPIPVLGFGAPYFNTFSGDLLLKGNPYEINILYFFLPGYFKAQIEWL